ncbi:MAG: hypothetical protein ACLR0U_18630 [Enterocloster clostridioformis]
MAGNLSSIMTRGGTWLQNQATDRTHRIGQDKQVTVYKLITRNTIEENILKLQRQEPSGGCSGA